MEQILQFITPCQPLTKRCKFSVRVFTSWISSGTALGLVLAILSIQSGAFFSILLSIPTAICVFGLVGLGISSSRGDNDYHAGWYWYFFPIVSYLVIGFWIAFAIVAFALSLAGVNLPKPSNGNQSSIDPSKFKGQIESMKVEQFLQDFGEQLEMVENNDSFTQQEKKVAKKIREFDRDAFRSEMRSALTQDELKILLNILLRILSGG